MAGLYEDGVLNDRRAVRKAKLHHKNLFLQYGNPQKLQFTFGIDHFVFWGGYTPDEDFPENPKAEILLTHKPASIIIMDWVFRAGS